MKDIYDNNGKVIATVVDHYQIQKDLQEQFERSERERGGGGWNPSFVPGALAFLSIPAIFVIPFFLLFVQGFTFCGFGLIITIIQHFPIQWITGAFGEMNYRIRKEPIIFMLHHVSWLVLTAELFFFWKLAFTAETITIVAQLVDRIALVFIAFAALNNIIERFRKSDGY